MSLKRLLCIAVVLSALALALPVPGLAADNARAADDLSVYFRPAVRFGTDDRTLFILDFLVPVYRGDSDILFVNTKFTPDTDEGWETNLGLGYRRMVLADKLVMGGSLFYDHRKTAYGSHFDQIGLGLEAMADMNGTGLTGRLNCYQPLSDAKIGSGFGHVFYGNGIYTAGIEEPMTGLDYEAGIRIPWVSDYVETWAYAGGYHFFGRHVPDVNGFSARIEAMPADFVRLNVEYRNDTVNGGEYYGEVALEIPFSITNLVAGKDAFEGIGDVFKGSRTLKERMVEPVRRDVDIVVGEDYLSGLEAAAGGGALSEGVIFVSDANPGPGDGSYENPYNELSLAAADPRLGDTVSLVHVMAGDGSGTPGAAFTDAGVTVWGAGVPNPAYANVINYVPGWPLVTSTLTMDAPNMTVTGLNLDLAGIDRAIVIGEGAAGAGLSIVSNRMLVSRVGFASGILADISSDLGAPGAPVYIADNDISVVGDPFAYGMGLVSGGSLFASVLGNRIHGITVTASTSTHSSRGIFLRSRGGSLTADISGNTISDVRGYNAFGIHVRADSGDIRGAISGNTISDVRGYNAFGIHVGADSGDIRGAISGNTISGIEGNRAYGIYLRLYSGYPASITALVTGNYLEAAGTYEGSGLFVDATPGCAGTPATPLVFTGNRGIISAPVALAAAFLTNFPSASNVFIGAGAGGMGDNDFTSATGAWSGNWPAPGGPIWPSDGSFIHP